MRVLSWRCVCGNVPDFPRDELEEVDADDELRCGKFSTKQKPRHYTLTEMKTKQNEPKHSMNKTANEQTNKTANEQPKQQIPEDDSSLR